MSAGSLISTISLTAVAPYNDLLAVKKFFEAHGGETAAIIIEPVAHNVGALLPEPGFLSGLRELCDKYGSVLIFDEVITGVRHHIGGYQSICGVRPDITTLGKSLGNGYPIGAVAGPRSLMDRFTTHEHGDVLFAGTYNAHPQGVAAALSTLDILAEEPVHESINRLGSAARLGLTVLYAEFGVPAIVTGFGSIFVTYFMDPPCRTYSDLLRSNEEFFCRHRMELLDRGIIQMPVHLKRNHLTYAHTQIDIDELLEKSRDALIELLKPENGLSRAVRGNQR
jgi:glutamate-1-semialdehyde 2,1-aminomutase